MCANVLHVRVIRGGGGGPDKTILNSPRHLTGRGYSAWCAFLRHPEDPGFATLEAKARQWQAPLLAVDDRGALDWRVVSQLERLCQEKAISIWHGHDYKSNLLGLYLSRRRPMRLVTTVHGWVDLTWRTRLYYALDRRAITGYDAVICVSQDLFAAAGKAGVGRDRLHYVPNAVDCEDFKRRHECGHRREVEGLPPERRVVVAVGRLSPEKGVGDLLSALARLSDRGLDVELRLAGEGRQRRELERRAQRLGIAEKVRFLGLVEDPRPLYELADVLVSSSLREGMPNVLLEAMAYELPVVATRVAGVPAVVEDGASGLLVESGDVDGLTEGLARLINDAALRARFGSRGRRLVEEKWSFAVRMERMSAIYDELMEVDPRFGVALRGQSAGEKTVESQ